MSGNSPYFKCYPSDFLNGVADLSPAEIAVYTIVLMLLYDEGGRIPYEPKKIARRCNMRLPVCDRAINVLVQDGKLQLSDERDRKDSRNEHETAR